MTKQIPQNNNKDNNDNQDQELMLEMNKIAKIDYESELVITAQQTGALAVADLIAEYESDTSFTNKPLQAMVLVRLQDLQVRDYAMGVVNAKRLDFFIKLWQSLLQVAPKGYIAPVATILAAIHYENRDLANANTALKIAMADDATYGLAKLLRRVFDAKWPSDSFVQMRRELHPKVCEYLFGSTMAS
ncbi:MAG: hypothetical protein RLZZ378_496 [Actinomycetota bacterium]|jgi:hypothetical protein